MFCEKWDMGACSTGHFATEKSIITFSKRCDCTPMIAFVQIWKPSLWVGCAEIQFTYVHLILVGTSLVLSLKSKGQLGFWSARKKPNKGNQNQRKDKQITTKKKIPPDTQNIHRFVLRKGRRTQTVALASRLYRETHFGFLGDVGLKWMVGEESPGSPGRNGPLAIHHGLVFGSPNASSWAASSIIHGYRRPGWSRAFLF